LLVVTLTAFFNNRISVAVRAPTRRHPSRHTLTSLSQRQSLAGSLRKSLRSWEAFTALRQLFRTSWPSRMSGGRILTWNRKSFALETLTGITLNRRRSVQGPRLEVRAVSEL